MVLRLESGKFFVGGKGRGRLVGGAGGSGSGSGGARDAAVFF